VGHVVTPVPFPNVQWAWWHVATPKPPALGGSFGAVGHVVTAEPFPTGWRDRWHVVTPGPSHTERWVRSRGACGDSGALPCRVRSLAL
jgi:hypothetical protein